MSAVPAGTLISSMFVARNCSSTLERREKSGICRRSSTLVVTDRSLAWSASYHAPRYWYAMGAVLHPQARSCLRVYSWPGGEPMTLDAQPAMSTVTGCFRLTALSIALVACAAGCTSDKTSLAPAPAPQLAAAGPRFAPSGPDADEFGASQGYPVGDRNTFFRVPFLVGSQSHQDEIFPSRSVRRAATASSLARVASEPALRYDFRGSTFALDDYMTRNPATGLLVARDDTILVERYQYGRTDRDRFTSWSMAKTVTSMLIGIAIAEGYIRSVDDTAAAYLPE